MTLPLWTHFASDPNVTSLESTNPDRSWPRARRSLSLLVLIACTVTIACGDTLAGDPVAAVTVQPSRSTVPLGAPITLSFQFVVSPDFEPLSEDHHVMVHFLDSAGEMMWAEDHEPSIPTTQWQPGQTISYARRLRIPMYPYIGESVVAVGLYSATTGERLPLAGDSLGRHAYRGVTIGLEPQSESSFVMYQDGWHRDESDPSRGEHWRWTGGVANVKFRNPGSDAVFYIELEGRPELFDEPQQVVLSLAGEGVYTITLDTPEAQFHEVPLTIGQFGNAEIVTLDLSVDQTFVPSAISDSNDDRRTLGVRVFYLFLEPV